MPEKMSRSEWSKTPYAKSDAKDPDGAIRSLLAKYGIVNVQWTEGQNKNGRRAMILRFVLNDRGYRFALEAMDADATPEELVKQIKRVIFYYLKSTLEVTSVFVSAEQALFAFLELQDGHTAYEVAGPRLGELPAPDFLARLLPKPRADQKRLE